jgi:hypothetical protein
MHAFARRNPSPVTDTPAKGAAFRRWFGQSAVVDAKGKPLVVYHGTTAGGFDAFLPNYRKGEQLGFGIHFAADREFAAKYAEDPTVARKGKSPKVYEVYLSIQRPLVADAIVREGSPEFALAKKLAGAKLMTQRDEDGVRVAYMQGAIDKTSAERAERLIREAGYDGILYEAHLSTAAWTGMGVGRARTGSSRSFVVFDPSQVKSATGNAGTFDPADPSIYRNPAPQYVLLGVDDEVQVCDDCGKADLKCTVVLGVLDADGNIDHEVRFGRDCAAKALRKPRTVTAAKMEKLAREAAYNRVRAMTVGAPSRVKVEGGRFPTYYFAYPLTDGRTLIVQESDPSFRPPAGSWTRLREGAWVGHPAKSNPRRRNPAKLSYDVVGIHDTRDYERDTTGKWKPVPGSGEHRPCDVCQHDHVVHVVLREMREPTQADLAARTPAEAAFMVRAGVTVPTGNTPVVGRDCAEQMTGQKISKTSWDAATAKAVTASRRSRR